MRSIKIDKTKLIAIVEENKAKHSIDAIEAIEDYKEIVIKLAQKNLELANTGELKQIAEIKQMPPAPTSYEDSYSRALRMLELSIDDIIELEEDVFNQLVLDDWDWKRNFIGISTMYKTFK